LHFWTIFAIKANKENEANFFFLSIEAETFRFLPGRPFPSQLAAQPDSTGLSLNT
jgi:hypothetical protein